MAEITLTEAEAREFERMRLSNVLLGDRIQQLQNEQKRAAEAAARLQGEQRRLAAQSDMLTEETLKALATAHDVAITAGTRLKWDSKDRTLSWGDEPAAPATEASPAPRVLPSVTEKARRRRRG